MTQAEESHLPQKQLADILNFVALDIETTGLDSSKDEIIQIAAVRYRNGKQTDIYSSFVKPHAKVPVFIKALTHISGEELAQAPHLSEVMPRLVSFVGEDVIVGHNVAFDLGFIDTALVRQGAFPLSNPRWDTADLSRIYLPFTADHKLGSLCKFFHIQLENAHRADADAIATAEVICELTHYIYRHYNVMINARLLDLSVQAHLESTVYHYLKTFVEYQRAYALMGESPKLPQNSIVNVIDHEVPGAGIKDLAAAFGPDGMFAEQFENYEDRPGQLDMARKIWQAFASETHLAVEAGTGVGKSFAYLVPAMQFAFQSRAKVLVSTNTKNLQEQLFFKDIPNLRKILPIPFKASLVKGRDNYLCKRRWEEVLGEQTKGYSDYEAHGLIYLFIWTLLTNTGDLSENSSFDRTRFSYLWRRVNSDRYMCSNRKCHHYKACYVMNLRKQIETSSIVVANHSLLLADMQAENSTLGEYSYLVIDEAHNLMASASRHLGFELSYSEMNSLFNQIGTSQRRRQTGFVGLMEKHITKSLASPAQKEQILSLLKDTQRILAESKQPLTKLFNQVAERVNQADSFGKLRLKSIQDYDGIKDKLDLVAQIIKQLIKNLTAISNVLTSIKSSVLAQYDILTENLSALIMRLLETENTLLNLLSPDLDNYALWLENPPKQDRTNPASTICYAPIEVGSHLNNLLYNKIPSIIFTSATLALRGSFKYFMGQSGLNLLADKPLNEAIVDSPFDYAKQAKLLVGSFLPEPKDRFFTNQALGCLEQIVNLTEVGTMVLFTSYKDLSLVYNHLAEGLYHRDRPFFAQGMGGSRTAILNEFKRLDNAVLLGTSSFWEGIDVQGKALSILILYKLPFMVPSEPLVEAYIDKLEREEKDSFMHYMLPNALLRLRQGFGRLIRSKTDRGIVLIMDSRVSKKKYGSYFKQVLPCKSIDLQNEHHLINEVSSFFPQH